MCGILGYIAHGEQRPESNRFKKALESCSVRGKDATGIFTPERGIVKLNIAADKFITQFNDDIEAALQSNIMLAHCRATTRGTETKNENNHPHESDNFILIHNGGISRSEKPNGYKFRSECDSEIILAYVETYGVEEGLIKMNELDGMSIALYEKATGDVYLFRNTNPAHIIIDRQNEITYFGSTLEILRPLIRTSNKFGWSVWDGFNSFDTEAKKLYKLNVANGLVFQKDIKQTYYAPKPARSYNTVDDDYYEENYYYRRNSVNTPVNPVNTNVNVNQGNTTRKIIYRGGCPKIILDTHQKALI